MLRLWEGCPIAVPIPVREETTAMFTYLEGLPADTLGLVASGPLTHEDYAGLETRVETMLGHGPLKALYVLEDDVSEFSPRAIWDDQVFTWNHLRDFSHFAVVTDLTWARIMAWLIAPIMPVRMKLFTKAQMDAAKAWIAAPD